MAVGLTLFRQVGLMTGGTVGLAFLAHYASGLPFGPLLFVINLIGLGLGPVAVGALSDMFAGPMGLGEAQGVRWALIVSTMFGLVAFALFWAARKTNIPPCPSCHMASCHISFSIHSAGDAATHMLNAGLNIIGTIL